MRLLRLTSALSLCLFWSTLSHFVTQSSSSADDVVTDMNGSIGYNNSTVPVPVHNSENFTGRINNTNLKVQLLIMLPLNVSNEPLTNRIEKWDRGLEILPGAQVAVEAINNYPHLLPGYELVLDQISVNPCTPLEVHSNLDAYVPFVNGSVSSSTIGILGLYCDRLVHTFSPFAGRDEFGLFQLSGTTSPLIRGNRERYKNSHLNFISPSLAVYYEALFLLMRELGWKRVLVIFEQALNLTQVHNLGLSPESLDICFREYYHDDVTVMIQEIRRSEKNIIFVSAGANETAKLLCAAYDNGLVWPHYVWVLQDHSVSDLLIYTQNGCTMKKLMDALQGTILLRLQRKEQSPSKQLDTGYSYAMYWQRYMRLLNESGKNLMYNEFANVMHDAVWAFARALNHSLTTMAKNNTTLSDFIRRFGKKELSTMMEQYLQNLSFEGVSGHVHFSRDYGIEAMIDIELVLLNNTVTTIGRYNQLLGKSSVRMPTAIDLPGDKLPCHYNLVPLFVTVLLVVVVILCIALTTLVFVLFIKYRRYSEIKATSPYLSMLMFVGTYLILVSTLMQAVLTAVESPVDSVASSSLCGSVITGNVVGINLIFSTLLLRMLRVYHIFSYFGRTGKVWSDKVLSVVVFLIVGGDMVLLLVWFSVDPFTVNEVRRYVYERRDTLPHYEITQYCASDNITVWFSLVFGKMGILFIIVLFLAIKTRKIQRENFKDTKKVNVYIFITVLIIATLIPVWFVLEGTGNVKWTGVMIYASFGAIGLLNQLMLFTPKVFPPMLRSLGYNVCHSPRTKSQRATIRIRNTSNNNSRLTLSHSNPVRSPTTISTPVTVMPHGLRPLARSFTSERTSPLTKFSTAV